MKWVLIRIKADNELFVLDRTRWEAFKQQAFYAGKYEAEVVAEADEMLSLMRFKGLTNEG